MISFRPTAQFDQPAAVLLVTEEQLKANRVKDFNWPSLDEELHGLVKNKQFSGKSGELFPLSSDQQLVLLAGLGKEEDLNPTALRIAIRKILRSAYLKKTSGVEIVALQKQQDDTTIIAIIEGILIGAYIWEKYKSKDEDSFSGEKSYIIIAAEKKRYQDAITICQGVNLARDLVNDNADLVTATFMEQKAKKLCADQKNCELDILGRKELSAKGLNLHLAVNQGSANEPRLIIVRYHGSAKKGYDVALIGKGLTFDTGGLNLKPTGSIETMRSDMSGAAAVLGTLQNALHLKIKKNILFVCAMAENAIGSRSYKPGDVIKGYSGKTVEIANTDAEGRLVLADALAYVNATYQPKQIIDIATLTGACVVALGQDYTGLLSNNDALAQKLIAAANQTDDRVWQLPLYKELKDCMKSPIADLKNTSNIKGAGTITGAYFLQQFVDKTPWAHLDIAGTAMVEKDARLYFNYGATGAGVRLLTEYLRG